MISSNNINLLGFPNIADLYLLDELVLICGLSPTERHKPGLSLLEFTVAYFLIKNILIDCKGSETIMICYLSCK